MLLWAAPASLQICNMADGTSLLPILMALQWWNHQVQNSHDISSSSLTVILLFVAQQTLPIRWIKALFSQVNEETAAKLQINPGTETSSVLCRYCIHQSWNRTSSVLCAWIIRVDFSTTQEDKTTDIMSWAFKIMINSPILLLATHFLPSEFSILIVEAQMSASKSNSRQARRLPKMVQTRRWEGMIEDTSLREQPMPK
jgi:hypothetical protein